MPSQKRKHPVFYDEYGTAKILTKEQLFRFLQIKGYISKDAVFDDYKDNLQEYVVDISENNKLGVRL